MKKPNRYLLDFQGPAGTLEIDETAWTAEDAITQARYSLAQQLRGCPEPQFQSEFTLVCVQPWTPELVLGRQDARGRRAPPQG